jgi:Cu/Ag efflux protein CusF
MRKLIVILAALVALGAPGSFAASHLIDGQVTKIDQSAGKITLRHGPIRKLDMDSMSMVFRVQDPAMLQGIKVGDKVKFEADRINGQITVTRMEKAK